MAHGAMMIYCPAMTKEGTTLPLPSRISAEQGRDADGQMLRVVVCRGPDAGRTLDAPRAPVVVGRGENADIRLNDLTVSQFHVQLAPQVDGVLVLDLRSRNGVWFGGSRIERALLPYDSMVTLGESALRLELGGRRAAADPIPQQFGRLIGRSAAIMRLYPTLLRLAATELSVILQGPTGSGKEEIARALHAASPRAKGPFVVLDCTVLPEPLAASILFGNVKGAFTGATEARPGLFDAAHGGVLFLDELGELPTSIQPMLLRALQSGEFRPVGAEKTRRVDIRILGATWRDLRAMVNQSQFREDLYYRVAEATVPVPALSERQADVPLLVQHFLAALPPSTPGAREIEPEALTALCARHFPGNVRELRSTVLRLAQLAAGPSITQEELQMESLFAGLRGRNDGPALVGPDLGKSADGMLPLYKDAKRTAMDEFERHYLERLLARAGRSISLAAALAGLQRANLRHLLVKHGLKGSDSR